MKCSNLSSVTLPSTLTTLGGSCFAYCGQLTAFDLTHITTVGSLAFSGAGLTSVDIPSGLVNFEQDAFRNLNELTSVTLPSTMTELPVSIFNSCEKLTSIDLTHITVIGNGALGKTGLTSIDLPDGLTTIGNSGFSSCSSLTRVSIPEGVETIGKGVFFATKLTSVTIPVSVTRIGNNAFESCPDLTDVRLALGTSCVLDGSPIPTEKTRYYAKEKVEAQPAACSKEGSNIAYWIGYNEEKYITSPKGREFFILEDGVTKVRKPITGELELYPALEHKQDGESMLLKHDKVEPTYQSAGTNQYWECSLCHDKFSDADGTNKIMDESTLVIPKLVATTGISLDKTALEMKIGETVTLRATVSPDNATDKTVEWTSSDPSVVTVDASGNVKTVGNGTATVTAISTKNAVAGGIKATCSVTVKVSTAPDANGYKFVPNGTTDDGVANAKDPSYQWKKNSGKDLLFIVKNAADDKQTYTNFQKNNEVLLDGKPIDASHYTAREGSLRLTLKVSYLQTLKEKTHTITIKFTDGEVSHNFTVLPASGGTDTPGTGENGVMIVVSFLLLAVSSAGAVYILLKRKKSLT